MSRRGFFWFSAKWLHYKVWPAWTWWLAKGLIAVFIAILTAWGLSYLYFYLFPPPAIAHLRAETQSKIDSLQILHAKLSALRREKAYIDSVERLIYGELTAVPPRKADSVTPAPYAKVSPVLLGDTLVRYVERVRVLLARQMQQEELLQRLAKETAYLPRHRPVEKGEIAAGFGMVYHPITMQTYEHKGLDFIATPGAPVFVTADGIVREVSPLSFGENSYKVVVEHTPAFHTLYYPVDPTVHPGQLLSRGTRIGYVTRVPMGRTAFLHYEVWRQSQSVDPLPYLWGELNPEEIAALQKAFQSLGNGLH